MSRNCCWCGDDVDARRWAIGIRSCMVCGEASARAERASWCVVQEYGKGAYQYVTPSAAKRTLRETNQKQPR
jgi:hypothetical protein